MSHLQEHKSCLGQMLCLKSCLSQMRFPMEWEKANAVPKLYKFLNENNLLSSNHSGFRPGDSCINQLVSITHKIYQSFGNDLEVRGVFLDISKAFDKVWHEGLILKLSRNGISGNLLYVLKDFLKYWKYQKQRAALNVQNSSWKGISSGVLQGSILGQILFLICINDLPDGLTSNCKLFADDTSLFSVVHDVTLSSSELKGDLAKISEWAFKWKMTFNPDPSKQAQEVIFSRKLKTVSHPSITFNNDPFKSLSCSKTFGISFRFEINV